MHAFGRTDHLLIGWLSNVTCKFLGMAVILLWNGEWGERSIGCSNGKQDPSELKCMQIFGDCRISCAPKFTTCSKLLMFSQIFVDLMCYTINLHCFGYIWMTPFKIHGLPSGHVQAKAWLRPFQICLHKFACPLLTPDFMGNSESNWIPDKSFNNAHRMKLSDEMNIALDASIPKTLKQIHRDKCNGVEGSGLHKRVPKGLFWCTCAGFQAFSLEMITRSNKSKKVKGLERVLKVVFWHIQGQNKVVL